VSSRAKEIALIAAAFFDVGETIVDETRNWASWADWLGVPRHTFSAVFGAVLARGQDWHDTFQVFRPGFDFAEALAQREQAGVEPGITEETLYADARPCLEALRAQGLRLGLAGNQPVRSAAMLRALDLPIDVIGISDEWGVAKPSREFFARVVAEAQCPADQVLYVGDRIDNDVRAAMAAGLPTALLRRGPWGYILDDPGLAAGCLFRLDSLADLPALVANHNIGRPGA
jgi:FMN phosphatase YigB (HAD superfamily)